MKYNLTNVADQLLYVNGVYVIIHDQLGFTYLSFLWIYIMIALSLQEFCQKTVDMVP